VEDTKKRYKYPTIRRTKGCPGILEVLMLQKLEQSLYYSQLAHSD